jgi:hypothetical protein
MNLPREMTPDDLLALDDDGLAEHLTALALRARRLAADGDVVGLHAALDAVRAAGDRATGHALALLGVAEEFLRALARSDLGRSEMAIRRLFASDPACAGAIFSRLLRNGSIAVEDLAEIGSQAQREVDALVHHGVLHADDKVCRLVPSFRALVQDLLEPPVLRMWRYVQEARSAAIASGLGRNESTTLLAAKLALTGPQVERHLDRFPLDARPSGWSQGQEAQRSPQVSRAIRRPLYRDRDRAIGVDASTGHGTRPLEGQPRERIDPVVAVGAGPQPHDALDLPLAAE